MEEKSTQGKHMLKLADRRDGRLTGVRDVVCFQETEIILLTEGGMLHIKGEELHVKRLDLEKQEVDLAGKIDSLIYSDGSIRKDRGGEGIMKRLFR